MLKRFLAAGAFGAMLLALPAVAQQAYRSPTGSVGAPLTTALSCTEHIKMIDSWMLQNPQPSTNILVQSGDLGIADIRNAAEAACRRGDDQAAFPNIAAARRMLGMPVNTLAQADVDRAVTTIRQNELAGMGYPQAYPGQPG